jgi:cell division protease FtsH
VTALTSLAITPAKIIEIARSVASIQKRSAFTPHDVFLAVLYCSPLTVKEVLPVQELDQDISEVFTTLEGFKSPSPEEVPWVGEDQKTQIQTYRVIFEKNGSSKVESLMKAAILVSEEEVKQSLVKWGADPKQLESAILDLKGIVEKKESLEKKEESGKGELDVQGDFCLPASKIRMIVGHLKKHVYGQNTAVEELLTSFYRLNLTLGTESEKRESSINSVLFVGPPGTGKTHLATSLTIAAKDSGIEIPVHVIPMARYSVPGSEGALTGHGDEFKGGKKEGELIRVARLSGEKPYVIVFDEIDRSSKEAMNLLLSLLSEGYLTDTSSKNHRKVHFNNALLVFTSNADPLSAGNSERQTFYGNGPVLPQELLKDALKKSIRTDFSRNPGTESSFTEAFLDRIQSVVPFKNLGIYEREEITRRELGCIRQRLEKAGIKDFSYDDSLLTHIALSAGVRASGRQVIATVKEKLENLVMHRVLWSEVKIDTVSIRYSSEETARKFEALLFEPVQRVLYIEDDIDGHNRLIEAIDNCSNVSGQKTDLRIVDTTPAARELLEKKTWTPDIIILDLSFPAESQTDSFPAGLNLLKDIRQTYPKLPVIIFSDLLHSEEDEAYWSCIKDGGAKGFISKQGLVDDRSLTNLLHQQLRLIGSELYQDSLVRSGKRVSIDLQTEIVNSNLVLWVDTVGEKTMPTIEDAGWFKVVTGSASFDDLLGVKKVAEEFRLAVDYLKNPGKFSGSGAAPPTGYVLHGPPGTGKTSIARALAGEAKALFIACEASEFHKKYVGEGAEKIRELFSAARKYTPVVVFIDELDALGSRDNSGTSSNSQVDVLNAFLSALDGFERNEGILVVGATNRLEALDKALVRPGRLGKKILIDIPRDRDTRLQLISKYFKEACIDVDHTSLDLAARLSVGMSPAAIREWARQLAWNRRKNGDNTINRQILAEARSATLGEDVWEIQPDKAEVRRTAVHEAGHGLVALQLGLPILQVSILARAGSLGVLELAQEDIEHTEKELKARLSLMFGGCEAENLVFNTGYSEGASGDMASARKLAEHMICELGMGDSRVPLGRQGNSGISEAAEKEVIHLLKEAQTKAKEILVENSDGLERLTEKLLEKKTVFEDEMVDL